ncbi:MAG TPA: carboxypeptidase-like regulatory domain-containing protein, partial [Methanocella sp.]|nr:carboxypeptidase-like regulatory domain-containing protein [Methanocella sp.]
MKKILALLLISFIVLTFFVIIDVSATSQTFTATGTVLDRHGQPVKGATVTLEDGGSLPIGTTTTDDNGAFNFVDAVITGEDKNCRVEITYTDGDKTYYAGGVNMRWVSAETSGGRVTFDTTDTTLTDYPPPEYGYLTGTLLSDGSNTATLGNGVVYVKSNDLTYYTITSNGADKGHFSMRLPTGHYEVYAQYTADGKIYQSPSKDVDITGVLSSSQAGSININVPMSVGA